jgi:lysozyme family protein
MAPLSSTDGFKLCIQRIFELEGYISNDPDDPGGLTKWGISQRAFPDVDILALTEEKAEDLYREHYWDPLKGNILWAGNPPVALLALDGAVQHGVANSILLLQRALKVKEDGVLGTISMTAAAKAGVPELARLLALRAEFYVLLVQKKPPMVKYRNGWFQRLFKMALWAQELVSSGYQP